MNPENDVLMVAPLVLDKCQRDMIDSIIKDLRVLQLTGNPVFYISAGNTYQELGHDLLIEAIAVRRN